MTKKIQAHTNVIEGEIVDDGQGLSYESLALPILTERQFRILTQPVPPHAIKLNQGFKYPASGWIKQVLFQAFGMDWDWKLLPIEGDKYYTLHPRVEKGSTEPTQYVAVLGQLTIRVRDEKLKVLGVIEKTGVGSQTWRGKMEFGDCVKGAKTDALRNAAYDLGIAREMKWDDQAELNRYEEQKAEEARLSAAQLDTPPTTLVELLTKAQRKYGYTADMVTTRLGVGTIMEVKDFASAWVVLSNGNA